MVLPAVYAMRATRYLDERGAKPEDLAASRSRIATTARSTNTPSSARDDGRRSAGLADDRRPADAAAVLSVASRWRRGGRADYEPPSGTSRQGAGLGRPEGHSREARRRHPGCRDHSARGTARLRAGWIGPHDVDVVELHDAFTIAELLYYEALGLADHGEGFRYCARVPRSSRTRAGQSERRPACKGPSAGRDRRGADGRDHVAAARPRRRASGRRRPHRARAMHRRRHRGRGPRGLGRAMLGVSS